MAVLAIGAALLSLILTRVLIGLAPRLHLMDSPNLRSSHTQPTPRGGGIAIVVAFSIAVALAVPPGWIAQSDAIALLAPAWAVAAVGFLDDLRGVRPSVRLGVHLGAAGVFLFATGGVPATGLQWIDASPVLGIGVAVLAMTWSINFFNFMDGIDGIAGSEALFVSGAMAVIAAASGQLGVLAFAVALASAVTGFLALNWPPARIFMGDVGSGFLGFVIAAIALLEMRSPAVSVWVLVLLPAVFLADSTVTLTRRALRMERLQQAHRSHAYQWLARRWNGHRKVTLLCVALNLLLVAPAVALASLRPSWAGPVAAVVLGVLAALAAAAGAGRPEHSPERDCLPLAERDGPE